MCELREHLQKLMIELLQEKINLKLKIRGEYYDEKESDKKCIKEIDNIIQTIVDYLKLY